METLDTVPDLRPDFQDARMCKQWLSVLPLTNVHLAHQALSEQLLLLNKFALPVLERFRILEMLRETVAFVQIENSKKYVQKPLPLNSVEFAAWQKSCVMWAAITHGYELCLEASNALLAANASALCHRCLRYTGLHMLEYVHGSQQFDPALWRRLHHFYLIAETNAFAAESVKDSLLEGDDPVSCNTAYVQALLLEHANPFDLNTKQLEQTNRWLGHWAYKVRVSAEMPEAPAVAPLAVDLESTEGLRAAVDITPAPSVRYLSMEKICSSLRKRVKFLRAGGLPEHLDLGEDCIQPACETLLVYLHQQWCESATPRTYQRRTSAALAQVCLGIPAAHYFISGKAFEQPRISSKLTQQEAQQMAVFGRVSTATAPVANQAGFTSETWHVTDESALGFRIAREATAGGRVGAKQLIALQPADSGTFLIGAVRWLMIDQTKLLAGVRLFPGTPQAGAVRSIGFQTGNEKFIQVLLLPAVAGLESVATLLIPPRLYQAHTQMELLTDTLQKITFGELVERGQDYDRVTFTSA